MGLALAVLLPAQVSAQIFSCDGAIEGTSETPGPFFEGDVLRIDISIGADQIDDGNNEPVQNFISIPGFDYYLDCGSGDAFPNCTDPVENDIEYLGNITTDCVTQGGPLVDWQATEANLVSFTSNNGPAWVEEGDANKCTVSFDIILNTVGADPRLFFQVFGTDVSTCDNNLTGTASGSLAAQVSECSLDLVKEVSVNGGVDWFDANAPNGPNLEFPPGDALYRLIVTNDGTADYIDPIVINDAALNIVNATIPLLLAGQQAVVGQGEIPELNALGRCTQAGALENVSDAVGVCRTDTLVDASDFDNAWVNCVPPPEIDIRKDVSVDGGTTWFDANIPADFPPAVEFPAGAMYRVEVCNTGQVDLTNVVVNDPTLGVVDFAVGDLAVGACVLLGSGDIPEFDVAERCNEPGEFFNEAFADGDSAVTGTPADQADDPATMVCVPPPEIDIRKDVSVDDGVTWFDANIPADFPPAVEFPAGADYRVEVCNTGDVDLVNVVVNDPTLGVVNYPVGDLAAGACVLLTSGEIPEFDVAERCDEPGEFFNEAFADGDSAETGTPADQADDPATMVCVPPPEIDITKEVSVDGGATWYDANVPADYPPAVEAPAGALYRVEVCNTGGVDLTNVVVNDPELGVVDYLVGDLAAGECVTLTSGEIPEFDVAERCDAPGIFNNVAFADGESAETGTPADQAEDPANIECFTTGVAICRTPGFWGARGGDAGDDDYKHGINITLEVLGDGVEVCGNLITNTDLESSASAIEAICINKGDPKAKYIRHATAAALNCELGDCGEVADLLVACNAACVADDVGTMNACGAELDCFNNGGMIIGGICHEDYGTCHPSGSDGIGGSGQSCSSEIGCQVGGEECFADENCHTRNLCPDFEDDGELNDSDWCFEPPGPASSPKKCNKARKNGDYVFEFPGWID